METANLKKADPFSKLWSLFDVKDSFVVSSGKCEQFCLYFMYGYKNLCFHQIDDNSFTDNSTMS